MSEATSEIAENQTAPGEPVSTDGEATAVFEEVSPPVEAGSPKVGNARTELDFSRLPSYSRSLLRITVPVRVVLAAKKESLQDVVELAPGSIITFEKSCDEHLHLQVGTHKVAVGEAVKVGDKFGFRVSSMMMPEEHFLKVKPKKTG